MRADPASMVESVAADKRSFRNSSLLYKRTEPKPYRIECTTRRLAETADLTLFYFYLIFLFV